MWIAIALALAVHFAIAGLMPSGPRTDDADRIQVAQMMHVSIVHKATPTPRPRPTPKLVVPVILATPRHVVTKVHNPAPAAPKARAGLAKSIAHTRYHSRVIEHVAVLPHHAAGAGVGARGTGRGAVGTQGTGTGAGGQGTGTGSGGTGTGTGGYAAADEPCGFVEFVNIHTPHYDRSSGAFSQDIRLMVHFGDGSFHGLELDYPFVYANEAAFPWSDQNSHKGNEAEVRFQFPPAEKRASEPDVVQYVMKHSTPDGLTTLKDCKGM